MVILDAKEHCVHFIVRLFLDVLSWSYSHFMAGQWMLRRTDISHQPRFPHLNLRLKQD